MESQQDIRLLTILLADHLNKHISTRKRAVGQSLKPATHCHVNRPLALTWRPGTCLNITQLDCYQTFRELSKPEVCNVTVNCASSPLHVIYRNSVFNPNLYVSGKPACSTALHEQGRWIAGFASETNLQLWLLTTENQNPARKNEIMLFSLLSYYSDNYDITHARYGRGRAILMTATISVILPFSSSSSSHLFLPLFRSKRIPSREFSWENPNPVKIFSLALNSSIRTVTVTRLSLRVSHTINTEILTLDRARDMTTVASCFDFHRHMLNCTKFK